jgi:SNF2 family DNA or RNA helicase
MTAQPSESGIAPVPEQGQLVVVRQRTYTVTDISQSSIAAGLTSSVQPAGQHLVMLSSIEDDALGEELQVVWELEPGTSVQQSLSLPEPLGFDSPARLEAFLNAVRWGAASTADIRSIQSPFRSGIDIEDYQLDPVVRAIQMPRVNLLIADDVGLGKTIEAGMVLLELVLRHRARKALVVCPSSLQLQWRDQMRDKFGLEFRIVDSDLMRELRRTRGLHVNPWTHYPRLITSIDFLKRERPMRLFREILPTGDAPTYPRLFDLLILDEAHNVAPSGRGKYATDSLRTDSVRLLSPTFRTQVVSECDPA